MQFADITVWVFIFLLCIHFSLQYPTQPTCYKQVCPSGTTNCKKNTKSSPNKRYLEIRINCLDDYDGSLKEYFFEEPSILNPHTHYESSSFSAASGISDNYLGGYNGVENFS